MSDDEPSSAETTYVTETKYNPVTKLPLVSFTRFNGLLQATPDDKPSYVLFDEEGRPKLMEWHDRDELHREGAGAAIEVDPETGVHTCESFYLDGQPRAPSLGPLHILRDRSTGEVIRELMLGDTHFPPGPDLPEPT